jgi:dehydrogenase/reductase SDR family protein 12
VGRFVADTLRGRPLHCLVNSAARMFNGYEKTKEGHESAIALNLLGFYKLTTDLLPSLRADPAGGRCVTVTSAGMLMYSLDVSELRNLDDGTVGDSYDAVKAYCLTHRSRVLLAQHWGEEEAARGLAGEVPVRFASVHPGWVETPGLRGADAMAGFYALTKRVLRTAAEGADTPVWLAAGLDGERGPNGAYYMDRQARRINLPLAGTAEPPGTLKRLLDFCAARAVH